MFKIFIGTKKMQWMYFSVRIIHSMYYVRVHPSQSENLFNSIIVTHWFSMFHITKVCSLVSACVVNFQFCKFNQLSHQILHWALGSISKWSKLLIKLQTYVRCVLRTRIFLLCRISAETEKSRMLLFVI